LVQKQLRRYFSEWGRPQRVRVDNGSPWGSTGDLPPDLALWLFGLGIDVHWNAPRQPQQNGVIERSQGVAKAWAEPECCQNVRHLQRRLNHEDRLQREAYPSIDGQPRMAAYPQLHHSGRPYSWSWEQRHWDWSLACEALSAYVVRRRVDRCGKIGVYHHKLYVGTMHHGRDVYLHFDSERIEWVVSDAVGRQLHRTSAEMLSARRMRELRVTNKQ